MKHTAREHAEAPLCGARDDTSPGSPNTTGIIARLTTEGRAR